MDTGFCTLDCAWRSLVLGVVTSTFLLAVMLITVRAFAPRLTQMQLKWYFNFQYIVVAATLIGDFLFVAFADPELASRCFARFAGMAENFSATRTLSGAWLAIAFVLLARDGFRVLAALVQSRKFSPVKDQRLKDLLRDCAVRLDCARPVELCSGPGTFSPFAFGFFTHKIVLPEAMVELSVESLRGILSHELVHVRDRDSLWMLAKLVCQRFLFFHPLMLWLGREYELTVERAADEAAVVKGGVKAGTMLQSLVETVEKYSAQPAAAVTIGATRGFRELKLRMESLAVARERRGFNFAAFASMASISVLASVGISIAQADASVNRALRPEEMMCTQLHQEQMIESWLRIEPEMNKCEK